MSCYDRYDRSALQVFQKRLMIKTRFAAHNYFRGLFKHYPSLKKMTAVILQLLN